MKFFKKLGQILFVAIMILSVAILPAACKDNNKPDSGKTEAKISSITLSGQKTSFAYGEIFSVGSLVVTAKYNDSTEKQLSESEYVVDSSEYKATLAGIYEIKITAKNSSVNSTYSVKVNERQILPEPATEQAIYAYNELDAAYNDTIVNHPEPGIGIDSEWFGRYSVSVFAPGDEAHSQQVGLIAAWTQIHGAQLGMASVGRFDFNGKVVVRITANFAFEQVDIRPTSLGIEYTRSDAAANTIEFTLTKPCNLSVEFDGDLCKNLMLFSDYMHSYSKPSDELMDDIKKSVNPQTDNLIIVEPGTVDLPALYEKYSDTKHNIIVFGKGIYNLANDGVSGGIGECRIPSDSTVYIHGDAAIFGFVYVSNAKNVVVQGRGILSGRKMDGAKDGTILFVEYSRNVTIEGLYVSYALNWTSVCVESQNVVYRGIRIAGQRLNNDDGFDICGSSDILLDSCFIRTIDDGITIKAPAVGWRGEHRRHIENIVVQNTVVWNYQTGNGIVVGSESATELYNNIVFRDIDIIHNSSRRAIAVEIIDSATVQNVVFDDIRMDLTSTYSGQSTEYFPSDWENTDELIMLEVVTTDEAYYGSDTYDGKIDGVIFNNITFTGNPARKMTFLGTGKDNTIKNVLFNNVSFNGTVLNDYNAYEYIKNGSAYYSDFTFTEGSYYFEPTDGIVVDDKDMSFTGTTGKFVKNENLTGGGYEYFDVLLGNEVTASFNISEDGYYMPYINLKTNNYGGVFDVYLDGSYAGSVNTYSLTSDYARYYLPMYFVSTGEHTLTFRAKSLPNADFSGGAIALGIDYIDFVNKDTNCIEMETLSASGNVTRVKDMSAGGGYAVDVNAKNGDTIEFTGYQNRRIKSQLVLNYLAGPDKGIYKFRLNGSLISSDIDMYAEKAEYRTATMDVVELDVGNYTVSAICVGKNAKSSATNARLDYIDTYHTSVSQTILACRAGATADDGVTISNGALKPTTFGNIRKGNAVSLSCKHGVGVDGVYRYDLILKNYNTDAFDVYMDGEKVAATYKDGVLSFIQPSPLVRSFVLKFVCKGDKTYSFGFVKLETHTLTMDKSELRSLVEQEDVRKFAADTESWLIKEHTEKLAAAKEVLFNSMALQKEIDKATALLKETVSRIEEGRVYYNTALLNNNKVFVSFDGANDGDLAILYLDNGTKQGVYYALINNDYAEFTVGNDFVRKFANLYCQVEGNPLVTVTIEVGEKSTVAQKFTFANDYYEADESNAFRFDHIKASEKIYAEFDTDKVSENDVAVLFIRNRLNESVFEPIYAAINADGVACFDIPEINDSGLFAIVRVVGKDGVEATALRAADVKTSDVELGKAIANNEMTDGKITITSASVPASNGIIYAPAQKGFNSAYTTIKYDGKFSRVEIDFSILRYCGSGGPDQVWVMTANYEVLAIFQATTEGKFDKSYSFTYDECKGGIVLRVWFGCVGDWEQCKGDNPHAPEEVNLKSVRFYADVEGESTSLKLLGNNPLDYSEAKTFDRTYIDTLNGAKNLTATGDFSVGETVSMVLRNTDGENVDTINATCGENGKVIFDVSGVSYTGSVYAYFVKSNGQCVSADVDVSVSEEFHLGKALYNQKADSEAWDIEKMNGTMNINEDGILYNDSTNYFRFNYWIPDEHRALEGYDYSFTCKTDLSTVKSISIAYKFHKVCNHGGNDRFWIINGGQSVGEFSCQDMAIQDYSGTITIDESILRNCTSDTFYIFYAFGCIDNTCMNETLEFGKMTVERKTIVRKEKFVFTDADKYPMFVNKKKN